MIGPAPTSMVKLSAVPATAPTAGTWTTCQLPPCDHSPENYRYMFGYHHTFGYDNHVMTTGAPIDGSAVFTGIEEIIAGETSRLQVRIMTVAPLAAPADMPPLPVRCSGNPVHPYRYRINFWTGTEHGIITLDYNLPLATETAIKTMTGDVAARTGHPRATVYGLALFTGPGR